MNLLHSSIFRSSLFSLENCQFSLPGALGTLGDWTVVDINGLFVSSPRLPVVSFYLVQSPATARVFRKFFPSHPSTLFPSP